MVVLAIVCILFAGAGLLFPQYIEKAKKAEAELALAEIRRLESDFHARTGTYSSDLNQLGFHPSPPLQHHTVFVQVQKKPQGWGYMVLLMPNSSAKADGGGWYISQGPDGKVVSSLPGQSGAGAASGCAAWGGWGSMEGGAIEGEERLDKGSSSSNGVPPCAGTRVVQHGKGGGTAISSGATPSQGSGP